MRRALVAQAAESGRVARGHLLAQAADLADQRWEPLHAHNQALQTLAESGLIGAAALVALILTAVVATFARSGTMASLLVALLGFLAFQSTVEVPLGLTYFPISYLLPALCLAVFAYTGDLGRATRPVRER